MSCLTLRSPAKLNLYLQVINKRTDGFHNIKTLFERINLCDTIHLESNPSGKIRVFCSHPHVPTGPSNLVYRAARLLREFSKVFKGVDITITKRIPVAAGLAGGSSNAATVLLGLNRLWRLKHSPESLLACGQAIGSDVPFFLTCSSWGMGTQRGDCLEVLPVAVKLWHVVVVPCMRLYTPEVYGRLNLQLTKKCDDVNILTQSLLKNNIVSIRRHLRNDLESSIFSIRPRLMDVKERLLSLGVSDVSFSGSGPSLFGIVASKKEAETLRVVLSKRYKQVFVVRTL
jgi:4-diphosphocytidyl-2-C-methyl-D-erythritol kinase